MKVLRCKSGSYVKDGQTKYTYVDVGMVFEKDDGIGIKLFKHINIAGLFQDVRGDVWGNIVEREYEPSKEQVKPLASLDTPF